MSSDWDNWVSASKIRNWFRDDPLLDWLDLYGEAKGYVPDHKRQGYDPTTDFGRFIIEKGRQFEAKVIEHLESKMQIRRLGTPWSGRAQEAWEAWATETDALLKGGVQAIYQGAVIDPTSRMYGRPDLTVRNDALRSICDEAPEVCGDDHHYSVIDIKYAGVEVLKKGCISATSNRLSQLLVYNRGLAAVQGTFSPLGYLLGRTYERDKVRHGSCFAMLAPARMDDAKLAASVDLAADWMRRVRSEGADWQVEPEPTLDELRPNMGNTEDSPWHQAKVEINESLKDLTSLWHVSTEKRPLGITRGISRWDDGKCDASVFELSDDRARVLDCILASQRPEAPLVSPERISADRNLWHQSKPVQFYVDFETVSNLDDDFSTFPEAGGRPLIFMIGCGHEEAGEWRFERFIADRLDEASEASIIDAWIAHMADLSARFGEASPLVFHWSPAETSSLSNAFNSARERHPGATWPEPNWFDFLGRVMRKAPITIKGALAFGLKAVAKAMHSNGLIRERWEDGPGDGMAAMVGAWRCQAEAVAKDCRLIDLDLMKAIGDYNEVDCKVMWEIIAYLRAKH
ncbi:MAG: hypothetical protein H0W86_03025 [Armatimonadetes bacterium]|nr:hypothetical protein [Armatimonadota bacterium]